MIYRLAIIFTLLVIRAGAIPVGPTTPVNLQGEVKKWAWIDGTVSKSCGDDGMLTSIKTVPTYYIILEVAGLPQKTRDSLSYYTSSQGMVAINPTTK